MDFDPGETYDDGYMDGLDDSMLDNPDHDGGDNVEFDDVGNPTYLASAAGFGYHMASDELDERKIAEDLLKERDEINDEPEKLPLSSRHELGEKKKGYVTPFGKWATKANLDPKNIPDEIEYTKEEQLEILAAQVDPEDG